EMVGLPEGNGLSQAAQGALTTANHHVRWVDLDRHGFTIVEFTPDYAHADYWAVTSLTDPGAGAYPLASWRVRHGTDRLETVGPLPGVAAGQGVETGAQGGPLPWRVDAPRSGVSTRTWEQ